MKMELSESTNLLLTLHRELHDFKDDPEFHNLGFGVRSRAGQTFTIRFLKWRIRVDETSV